MTKDEAVAAITEQAIADLLLKCAALDCDQWMIRKGKGRFCSRPCYQRTYWRTYARKPIQGKDE